MTGQFKNRWLKPFASTSAFGIVLSLFAAAFPPIDAIAETNLAVHMAQHFLVVFGGILIGYSIYRNSRIRFPISGNVALLGIALVAGLLVFWHLPFAWDAAVLSPVAHLSEHLSFLFVGLSVGVFILRISSGVKFILLFLGVAAHMVYSIFLYVQSSLVYALYPLDQQKFLGLVMLAPASLVFMGSVFVTLNHETRKIEAEEAKDRWSPSEVKVSRYRRYNFSKILMPLLTITLLVAVVGYFSVAATLVYASNSQVSNRQNVLVYIVESPINWQYNPGTIRVVIGVNNTVTWVSHSLMRDTVTSSKGLFDSGPLDPGSSWTHDFTTPGVYEYHCLYHPWMKGTITVLS